MWHCGISWLAVAILLVDDNSESITDDHLLGITARISAMASYLDTKRISSFGTVKKKALILGGTNALVNISRSWPTLKQEVAAWATDDLAKQMENNIDGVHGDGTCYAQRRAGLTKSKYARYTSSAQYFVTQLKEAVKVSTHGTFYAKNGTTEPALCSDCVCTQYRARETSREFYSSSGL